MNHNTVKQSQEGPQSWLILKIPNIQEKVQNMFNVKTHSDFTVVIYPHLQLHLHRSRLRRDSKFYAEFSKNENVHTIQDSKKAAVYEAVLRLLYGYELKFSRKQFAQYYAVAKYFEVEELLRALRTDMQENVRLYDIFAMLKLAFESQEQKVFEIGLSFLEQTGYSQLDERSKSLLDMTPELFRCIVVAHEGSKQKGLSKLSYTVIANLIYKYCQHHKFNDEDTSDLLFDLISKESTSAEEYQTIFIEGAKTKMADSIGAAQTTGAGFKGFDPYTSFFYESSNTYSEKLNRELSAQKQNLMQKLQIEQRRCQLTEQTSKKLQEELTKLKNELHGLQLQVKHLQTENSELKKGWKKGSTKRMSSVMIESDQEEISLMESVKADEKKIKEHFQGQRAGVEPNRPILQPNFNRERDYENDQNFQDRYNYSIVFDNQPICIDRSSIIALAKLLATECKVKCYNLIYRNFRGVETGDISKIYGVGPLLILGKVRGGNDIGGITGMAVDADSYNDISDDEAAIFNLTAKRFSKVSKDYADQAYSVNQHSLICFGRNDLQISTYFRSEESECCWPVCYTARAGENYQALVGTNNSKFKFDSLEVYSFEGTKDIDMNQL